MRRAQFLLWLDVALLAVFAFLQEPVTTGLAGHEWISIGFAGLLFLHLLVNWRWIAGALGRYGIAARRARVNTWLNGALYLTMVFTIFSGLVVSRVVLPAVGLTASDRRAWLQLHTVVASVTLVIVGLHVALNWDWIVSVVRRWRARHHSTSHRSLLERLDLDGLGRVVGRFARLVLATVVACGVSFVLVSSVARARVDRPPPDRWKSPDFEEIPGEVAVQLLIVAVSAFLGRKVLRIRL
jgi:small-conductance mechanosensitive channel